MPTGKLPHDPNMSQAVRDWLISLQRDVRRQTRPIYIPASQFSGFYTVDTDIEFAGAGNPKLAEINSLGVVAAKIDAVNDACHHLFYVPKDFNVDTNIKYEVVWCSDSGTLTDTVTWKVEYDAKAEGEALDTADTVLDEVITADNVLGSYSVAVSPYGVMYASKLEHGDMLHLKISLAAVSGLDPAVDELFLLGILINDEG